MEFADGQFFPIQPKTDEKIKPISNIWNTKMENSSLHKLLIELIGRLSM